MGELFQVAGRTSNLNFELRTANCEFRKTRDLRPTGWRMMMVAVW